MHPFFQELKQGSLKLGLELTDEALELLLRYQDALVLWNKAYNLTAIRDPKEMLVKHLLDSLSILNDLSVILSYLNFCFLSVILSYLNFCFPFNFKA